MQREIKFRAWIRPLAKMTDSFDIKEISKGIADTFLASDIMQYTGLKDKNGKEIYESDIVKVNHPQDMTRDFTNSIQKVFWDEGGFCHGNGERPPKTMWKYCEVIGNVYENSELLK